MKPKSVRIASRILCLFVAIPALAQTASVRGASRDAQGAPIVGAQVEWRNQDTGRVYAISTNKNGEYFSPGIDPGNYTVTLNKDGKVLYSQKDIHVGIEELTLDIELKQIEQQNIQAAATNQGFSAEEIRKQQEEQANIARYNSKIKVINEKLKAAGDMMGAQPPRFDQAIAILTEVTQIAPDQDAVWYRLGVAHLKSANAQADDTEKTQHSTEAYNDLEKAIDLFKQRKRQGPPENSSKPPCSINGVCTHVEPVKAGEISDDHRLAVYYSNLGDAAARLGKNDEALKDFQQAAQLDLADAGTYYFDLGIILRNTAKSPDERKHAVEAFDKAIAADPDKAVAYYLKGEVLFGMVTTDSEGKIIPPPGAAEALEKYLELQPNGPYAEPAKSFLAALNNNVENSYGAKKDANKKK